MELWTALLLGLVGSLHCAGMCGPLALALPQTGATRVRFLLGRGAYNIGRISAYALLGAAFGLLGKTMAMAGFQRWASIGAGVAILLALTPAWGRGFASHGIGMVTWLKSGFSSLLKHRTLAALYLLGLLNGFLPCGLVYVAAGAVVGLGSVLAGMAYMVAFGLGTVPLMLGIALAGRNLQLAMRFRLQKLVPVCLAVVGALLILRGLSLGIPYLSPDLSHTALGHACH
jgi:uncharacterized protein